MKKTIDFLKNTSARFRRDRCSFHYTVRQIHGTENERKSGRRCVQTGICPFGNGFSLPDFSLLK